MAGGGDMNLPIAKLALLRHSGDTVDRVIFANLNIARACSVLFGTAAADNNNNNINNNNMNTNNNTANLAVSQNFTIRNVNRMIENILDTAHRTDATVHAIIGDTMSVTWNATSRVANADSKAMRFVTSVDATIKKELHQLYMRNNGSESAAAQIEFSPYLDPYNFVVSGAVVCGSAWCQLGGSSKRQQFALLNFSDADLMGSATQLGHLCKFVAVSKKIAASSKSEYLFRGCGIHALPGAEPMLFPKLHQKNNSASESRGSSRQESRNEENLRNSSAIRDTAGAPLPHQPQNEQFTPAASATATPIQVDLNPAEKPSTTPAQLSALAVPIYELCYSKVVMEEEDADEWLFLVSAAHRRLIAERRQEQTSNHFAADHSATAKAKNNNTRGSRIEFNQVEELTPEQLKKNEMRRQEELASLFDELVNEMCHGSVVTSKALFTAIRHFDDQDRFLPAYINLRDTVKKML
jgi:hypothetical protein